MPSAPEADEDWAAFLSSLEDGEKAAAVPVQEEPARMPAAVSPAYDEDTNNTKVPLRIGKPLILGGAAVLAVAILFAVLAFLGVFSKKIGPNVSAAGVSLDGMTKAQAARALRAGLGKELSGQDMEISLPGENLTLSPKESGVALDADAMAGAALESGVSVSANDYLKLDEPAIRGALEACAARLAGSYQPAAFRLEGDVPQLTETEYDPASPCPTLVLDTGIPGKLLDVDALYERIREAYCKGQFRVDASDLMTEQAPEKLSISEIYDAVAVEPVDASVDLGTKKLVPGVYGLVFDRDAAQKLLDAAAYGETVRVEMNYDAPAILGEEAYYQDVLGFCQTPHSTNENRNNNLRIACSMLNGVVLRPGETLSYNDTLGERTAEKGYLGAPAYSGKNLVNSLGGGICQVSSTLYLCSLYAELKTVDRVNHGFPVSYIPVGLDATVSWGSPDLKICNDSEYPVKIVAEEADGFVRIWIMGTETRSYYVRMAFGSNGRYAKSHICRYDRQTGELVSKEDGHLSAYMDNVLSIRGEIGSNEAYINTNVREQEPCEPTPETLTASKEYKSPNHGI